MDTLQLVSFFERLEARDNGCWQWTGAFGGSGKAYGYFYEAPRLRRAHRVAYEHWHGPIPDGMTIHHRCENKGCVNPEHLEAVTMRANLLASDTPARRNSVKTRCIRGHEFTPENTKMADRGRRQCKTCLRMHIRNAARRRRERERAHK